MKQGAFKKVLAGFAGFILLILVVWFVVVDWVVKITIESQGTKAVGAKVDVAGADLSLFPAGLEILGLQVTNPDSPMTNALAVNRIYSDIELMPLIKRKVIIDNLRMEGIRIDTPRKTSGALPGSSAKSSGEKGAGALPPWFDKICPEGGAVSFSIPKVEDILNREKLESLKLAQDLRANIDSAENSWQQRIKELPSQKDLNAYRERLNKLKAKGGGLTALLGSAAEVKSLSDDLKSEMDRIKKARTEYQAELSQLKEQAARLAEAPRREAQRLKAKYTVSAEGAAHLSRLLFGPSVCGLWQKGYAWYERLKPYMGGSSGSTEKAGGPKPQPEPQKGDQPDFLIRQLHVDALLDAGKFTGEAKDITSNPRILDKPLTFRFLGSQMKQIQKFAADGVLNFLQPGTPRHRVKVMMQGYDLHDYNLGDAEALPISIVKAVADVNMDLNLAGPQLNTLLKAQLDGVRMAVEKTAGTEISAALADAVAAVTQFGLTAAIQGSAPDYKARIQSDLDKVLSKAVGQIISKTTAKLESQLQAGIAQKIKDPLNQAQQQLGGFGDLSEEFQKRLNIGDNLLKEIKLPF